MPLFQRLKRWQARIRPGPLREWFHVQYDERYIYIQAEPPGRSPWTDKIAWDSIERIAFQAEGAGGSDGIYIFTAERPASRAIPTEADGGAELWAEILRRELFDQALAVEAASSVGGLFVWPPIDG